MISSEEILSLAKEKNVPLVVLEKDYVASHIINRIGSDSFLKGRLFLVGGLALKKFYYPDIRFTEDLHWVVVEESFNPERIQKRVAELLADFTKGGEVRFDSKPVEIGNHRDKHGFEGFTLTFFYHLLNSNDPVPRRMSCSLTRHYDSKYFNHQELPLSHPYSDQGEFKTPLLTPDLESLLTYKLFHLSLLNRGQDLWDATYILRYECGHLDMARVRNYIMDLLQNQKLKGDHLKVFSSLEKKNLLRQDWDRFIQKHLGTGADVCDFDELMDNLIEFSEIISLQDSEFEKGKNDYLKNRLPPTEESAEALFKANSELFIEKDRNALEILLGLEFATKNCLLVELRYKNSWRLLEPYSIRYTERREIGFYGFERASEKIKTFLITPSRIQGLKILKEFFPPRFPRTVKVNCQRISQDGF